MYPTYNQLEGIGYNRLVHLYFVMVIVSFITIILTFSFSLIFINITACTLVHN